MMTCQICGHSVSYADTADLGVVRGNTERFKTQTFPLWKCPRCATIHALSAVDFEDIYSNYPLNNRRLDAFAKGTMRNLLSRLKKEGLRKDHRILDFGCGNGLFVEFLKQSGYENVEGFDPLVDPFRLFPKDKFDFVVANDVIEHVADVREMIQQCLFALKENGHLYIGTADSEDVEMTDLEPHVMRLHQPFHRIIVTQASLHDLARETGFELKASYQRSYMDTWLPFSNYRFLDELSKAVGHNMDEALKPSAVKKVILSPRLWFYGLFGYFFPSAYEPAIILKKAVSSYKFLSDQPKKGAASQKLVAN